MAKTSFLLNGAFFLKKITSDYYYLYRKMQKIRLLLLGHCVFIIVEEIRRNIVNLNENITIPDVMLLNETKEIVSLASRRAGPTTGDFSTRELLKKSKDIHLQTTLFLACSTCIAHHEQSE